MTAGKVYQEVIQVVDLEKAIETAVNVATGKLPLIPWTGNWARRGRKYVELNRALSRELDGYATGIVHAFVEKAVKALEHGKKKQARMYTEIAVEYCKKTGMSDQYCRDKIAAVVGQEIFA